MKAENSLFCREDKILTDAEKSVFKEYLEKRGLSETIWLIFDNLIKIAEPGEEFVYIKCFHKKKLVGIALFSHVRKYSFGQILGSNLRKIKVLNGLLGLFSVSSYFSFSEILCANLTTTLFIIDDELKTSVKEKIMGFLAEEQKAGMIAFIDEKDENSICRPSRFQSYPYVSNSWINSKNYKSIHDYLELHKSTHKHLSQYSNKIKVEIYEGEVPNHYLEQMKECMVHSELHSRSLIPFEKTLRNKLFQTELFSSPEFVHIIVTVDHVAAGFTTFIQCGDFLGGIVGGYNRNFTKNTFIYDRIMVAALGYALEKNYCGVYFGIINNYTKLRLTDSYTQLKINLYIKNGFFRKIFQYFYSFSSLQELCHLEKAGKKRFGKL